MKRWGNLNMKHGAEHEKLKENGSQAREKGERRTGVAHVAPNRNQRRKWNKFLHAHTHTHIPD